MLGVNLTSQDKEDDPVHDQYWPEDGNVEDLEPGAEEGDADGAGSTVPELEFWETSDEGSELFVTLGRETTSAAILHLVVEHIAGGVKLGGQEGEEHVEEVDTERVGDYEPIC